MRQYGSAAIFLTTPHGGNLPHRQDITHGADEINFIEAKLR